MLTEAVVARTHRHRLAIATLEQFELPQIQRFADRVEGHALGVGLFERWQYFGKGNSQAGSYFHMQRAAWLRELRDAMHDKRVCAGGGAVIRPTELLHRERQAVQCEKYIRSRSLHSA